MAPLPKSRYVLRRVHLARHAQTTTATVSFRVLVDRRSLLSRFVACHSTFLLFSTKKSSIFCQPPESPSCGNNYHCEPWRTQSVLRTRLHPLSLRRTPLQLPCRSNGYPLEGTVLELRVARPSVRTSVFAPTPRTPTSRKRQTLLVTVLRVTPRLECFWMHLTE